MQGCVICVSHRRNVLIRVCGAVVQELTRARIPLKYIVQMMKRKLKSAPCRNKGFILDGFPRTVEEAKALFAPEKKKSVDMEEDEDDADDYADDDEDEENEGDQEEDEEDPENRRPKYDPDCMVDGVIELITSEENARARLHALREDQIISAHTDAEGFSRWAVYFTAVLYCMHCTCTAVLRWLEKTKHLVLVLVLCSLLCCAVFHCSLDVSRANRLCRCFTGSKSSCACVCVFKAVVQLQGGE